MEWFLALIASIITAFVTAMLASQREQKKLREELKLDYSIETAIRQLLKEQGWPLRSFDAIKHHIRGFPDDKLREYLVRSGAIAFEDEEGVEVWGLLELNKDRLAKKVRDNDLD